MIVPCLKTPTNNSWSIKDKFITTKTQIGRMVTKLRRSVKCLWDPATILSNKVPNWRAWASGILPFSAITLSKATQNCKKKYQNALLLILFRGFQKASFQRTTRKKKSLDKDRTRRICHHSGDRPADFLSTAPPPHPDGVMHKNYVYQFLKCIRSYMCLPVSPTLALSLFALRGTIFASPYIFLHLCLSLCLCFTSVMKMFYNYSIYFCFFSLNLFITFIF